MDKIKQHRQIIKNFLAKTGGEIKFSVREEVQFSAQHQILLPNGKFEPLHSHNWKVRVYISSKTLDDTGLVTDFIALKKAMIKIAERWDGKNLNKLPPFSKGLSPSAEMVAYLFYINLREKLELKVGKISKIEVREAPTSWAILEIPD